MRRNSSVLMMAVLVLFGITNSTQPADAQVPGGAPAPALQTIATSALGEAKLTPDRATIYVGVQSRSATATAAARDNAQRQTGVINALVALGIPREQISTENYSVMPETRFDQTTQKATVTGYVVSNVVRVELQHIEQVASVIDAALGKGANQINSLDFSSSNTEEARHRALAAAVATARGDAEAMAQAAGGSLGTLLELSSSESSPRPVFRVAAGAMAAAAATPIEPGQQTVSVSISARWQFVAGR